MDKTLIRTLLTRFNKAAFITFTKEFYENTDTELIPLKNTLSEDLYYHPLIDSYGGSLHELYIFNYFPLEVFKKTSSIQINKSELENILRIVRNNYNKQTGYWGMVSPYLKKARKLQSIGFLTNFFGYTEDDYHKLLFPQYSELVKHSNIKADLLLIGSYDSFIDKNYEAVLKTFNNFFLTHIDGLSINLNLNEIKAEYFVEEKNLISGVFSEGQGLYEPVYVNPSNDSDILLEFSSLLQKANVSESTIELFLKENYKSIFGPEYDMIETQLWLKFPELDIRSKNRRLDIFLRNSIEKDWELFEIKKPSIKLTKSYRDIPVFCNQIITAKQQLKNYKKLLDNDAVKRKFANSGIEYFEPTLRLVVGRKPPISIKEWRFLKESNKDEVKIITYDDLISEMSIRLNDRESLLRP